jgi:intermediate cleaving peptidase 55
MRLAGKLSGTAITGAMRNKWTQEKDLHSYLDHQFRMNGCDGEAYVPVVAGGEVSLPFLQHRSNTLQNALGIHYVRNDASIRWVPYMAMDLAKSA